MVFQQSMSAVVLPLLSPYQVGMILHVLEKMMSRYLSPIRPGRCFERNKNNKNAVSFTYRIS